MIKVASDWNPKQTRLKTIVKKQDHFREAVTLCLDLHGMAQFSEVAERPTLSDAVWDGLTEDDFAAIPRGSEFSIAWYFWHLARIEDLTTNLLIAESDQVLDGAWLKKLGVAVRDTGNAMNNAETIALSRALVKPQLRSYRNAVGERTRKVLGRLRPGDMRRKIAGACLDRILAEGGVLEDENSRWLLDFWGRKDVAGLLQMPVTRHQIVHLNDCVRIRKRLGKAI